MKRTRNKQTEQALLAIFISILFNVFLKFYNYFYMYN